MSLQTTYFTRYLYLRSLLSEDKDWDIYCLKNKEKILKVDGEVGLITAWLKFEAKESEINRLILLGCSFEEKINNPSPLSYIKKQITTNSQLVFFDEIRRHSQKPDSFTAKKNLKKTMRHIELLDVLSLLSQCDNTGQGIFPLVTGLKGEINALVRSFGQVVYSKSNSETIQAYILAIRNQTEILGWTRLCQLHPTLGDILVDMQKYFKPINLPGGIVQIDFGKKFPDIVESMAFFSVIQEQFNLQQSIPLSTLSPEVTLERKHHL